MKAVKKPSSRLLERKEPAPEGQTLFYYGESNVGVDDPEWRSKTTNLSRHFAWEAAIATVRAHDDKDLERLKYFSKSVTHIKNPEELTVLETRTFGFKVTAGIMAKRLRFWQFVTFIFDGVLPTGHSNRSFVYPPKISPLIRSNQIASATKTIAALARVLINNGVDRELCYHAVYTFGQEEKAHLSGPVSPDDVNREVWPYYASLHNWSNQG